MKSWWVKKGNAKNGVDLSETLLEPDLKK